MVILNSPLAIKGDPFSGATGTKIMVDSGEQKMVTIDVATPHSPVCVQVHPRGSVRDCTGWWESKNVFWGRSNGIPRSRCWSIRVKPAQKFQCSSWKGAQSIYSARGGGRCTMDWPPIPFHFFSRSLETMWGTVIADGDEELLSILTILVPNGQS
jgi:hypothetical protein